QQALEQHALLALWHAVLVVVVRAVQGMARGDEAIAGHGSSPGDGALIVAGAAGGGARENGRMSTPSDTLANQLLVALPALADPNFARSVALICQRDGDGAMGVLVNRPSEYTLGQILAQMGIGSED